MELRKCYFDREVKRIANSLIADMIENVQPENDITHAEVKFLKDKYRMTFKIEKVSRLSGCANNGEKR